MYSTSERRTAALFAFLLLFIILIVSYCSAAQKYEVTIGDQSAIHFSLENNYDVVVVDDSLFGFKVDSFLWKLNGKGVLGAELFRDISGDNVSEIVVLVMNMPYVVILNPVDGGVEKYPQGVFDNGISKYPISPIGIAKLNSDIYFAFLNKIYKLTRSSSKFQVMKEFNNPISKISASDDELVVSLEKTSDKTLVVRLDSSMNVISQQLVDTGEGYGGGPGGWTKEEMQYIQAGPEAARESACVDECSFESLRIQGSSVHDSCKSYSCTLSEVYFVDTNSRVYKYDLYSRDKTYLYTGDEFDVSCNPTVFGNIAVCSTSSSLTFYYKGKLKKGCSESSKLLFLGRNYIYQGYFDEIDCVDENFTHFSVRDKVSDFFLVGAMSNTGQTKSILIKPETAVCKEISIPNCQINTMGICDDKIYVSCMDGDVFRYSPSNSNHEKIHDFGSNPEEQARGMSCIQDDGEFLVAYRSDNSIHVTDLNSGIDRNVSIEERVIALLGAKKYAAAITEQKLYLIDKEGNIVETVEGQFAHGNHKQIGDYTLIAGVDTLFVVVDDKAKTFSSDDVGTTPNPEGYFFNYDCDADSHNELAFVYDNGSNYILSCIDSGLSINDYEIEKQGAAATAMLKYGRAKETQGGISVGSDTYRGEISPKPGGYGDEKQPLKVFVSGNYATILSTGSAGRSYGGKGEFSAGASILSIFTYPILHLEERKELMYALQPVVSSSGYLYAGKNKISYRELIRSKVAFNISFDSAYAGKPKIIIGYPQGHYGGMFTTIAATYDNEIEVSLAKNNSLIFYGFSEGYATKEAANIQAVQGKTILFIIMPLVLIIVLIVFLRKLICMN